MALCGAVAAFGLYCILAGVFERVPPASWTADTRRQHRPHVRAAPEFPDLTVRLQEASVAGAQSKKYRRIDVKVEIVNREPENASLRCWLVVHNEEDTVSSAWKQREAPIFAPARTAIEASFHVLADSATLVRFAAAGRALPPAKLVRVKVQDLLTTTERSFDAGEIDPFFKKQIERLNQDRPDAQRGLIEAQAPIPYASAFVSPHRSRPEQRNALRDQLRSLIDYPTPMGRIQMNREMGLSWVDRGVEVLRSALGQRYATEFRKVAWSPAVGANPKGFDYLEDLFGRVDALDINDSYPGSEESE
jgi:hypothetical protein